MNRDSIRALFRRNRADLRPGLRLYLLLLVAVLLQPAPVLVTPGSHQTVSTTHAITGVHTRLTDEVEEWKIKRTLEMVREMGAPWIVEFFPWAYYHGEDGGIAWQHPDMVVEHAAAQGLQIIARIGLTPEWARPEDTPLTYLDATAYDDFAAFAAAFAARYRGKVGYLIVGNEPNLSYEWGYRQTTPADYVALLRTVYGAVKEANPDIAVLGGALALPGASMSYSTCKDYTTRVPRLTSTVSPSTPTASPFRLNPIPDQKSSTFAASSSFAKS